MGVKNIFFGTITILGFILASLHFLKINSDKYIQLKETDISRKPFFIKNTYGNTVTNSFKGFLEADVKKKSVLIFEFHGHHHECIPGFAKYFYDLGYGVDILIEKNNEDSLHLFYPDYKMRIFLFRSLYQLERIIEKVRKKFEKYDYVLINSTDTIKKKLYTNLGALYSKKGIFVAHDVGWAERVNSKLYDENRAITLGNLKKGTRVNPHYFGDLVLKDKNPKTKFFMTSTVDRDYNNLIKATQILKDEGHDFEIIVIGRSETFNRKSIPKSLKDNYKFDFHISYSELYKRVESTDFLIILLDPKNEDAKTFKHYRATGSAQLSLGFLKPPLIHKEYASIYDMTEEDSFLFDDDTFLEMMRKAITMTNEEYKEKRNKFKQLVDNVYHDSLNNLKGIMRI